MSRANVAKSLAGVAVVLLLGVGCTSGPLSEAGLLEPGETYIGEGGVVLGALEGTLAMTLEVTVREESPPEVPLPGSVKVLGAFYRLSASQDTFGADSPFLLGLPVPEDAETGSLGLALLLEPQDVIDADLDQPVWQLLEGAYDPENDYFVTTLALMAAQGRIVVLVSVAGFESASLGGSRSLVQRDANGQETTQQQATPAFEVSCRTFDDDEINNRGSTCSASDEADLESLLEDARMDYSTLGFPAPYLRRGIDASASSFDYNNPTIVFGDYLADLRPFRDVGEDEDRWPCGTSEGLTNLGGYSSASRTFFVCIDNSGVTSGAGETARHEYFHATQYGYAAVRSTNQTWVKESTAAASEASLSTMARDTSRPVRDVDVGLTATDPGAIEYQTQDFFVYVGLELGRGLDYLTDVFKLGATASAVDAALTALSEGDGLGDYYWLWARNQSFESSVDLGGGILGNTCAFTPGGATPSVIDYDHISPPSDRTITLGPLTSEVLRFDLHALPNANYTARIDVKALGARADVRVKFYDAADAASTNCFNAGESHQLQVNVVAGQSRTFYALVSNVSLQTSAGATLEFPGGSPAVDILSPTANATYEEGDLVEFLAVASGFEGANPTATLISWSYPRYDGVPFTFGSENGETISIGSFCDGTYTVTATALDASSSQTANEKVTFKVVNTDPPPAQCAPEIDIISPADGATFAFGSAIDFEAMIDDDHPETDEPLHPVIWRDGGPNGTIIQQPDILEFSRSKFGVGTHDIHVEYGSAADQISIEIVDTSNAPPEAAITSPADGSTYLWTEFDNPGAPKIDFTGTGSDAEDGVLAGVDLNWSYRPDGATEWLAAGTGTAITIPFSYYQAGYNTYLIRLQATDSEGLSQIDEVEIRIQSPPS